MYKAHRIFIFLAVFLCLVLTPVLLNLGNTAAQPAVALDTPEIGALAEQQCVESVDYMRAEHMQLLESWRNEVVRNGATTYTSGAGEVYQMSLEEGCLSCHSNRAEFCDSCHSYVAVDPNCWDCHIGSEGEMGA